MRISDGSSDVGSSSLRLAGFEALLRWNHPRRGMVSPYQFIPVAEESVLISQLGEWVLRTACMEAAQWPDPIRIAVNLSPVQFYNVGLASTVMNALAASQIAPGRVELEITEGVFLRDPTTTRLPLQQLPEMGVRLAPMVFEPGFRRWEIYEKPRSKKKNGK